MQLSPRIFFVIIIVATALIIGGLWYFVWTPNSENPSTSKDDAKSSTDATNQTPSNNTAKTSDGTAFQTYQNSAMGLSLQYAPRYFVTPSADNSSFIRIKLNKTADRKVLQGAVLDRTAHMEIISFKKTEPPLLSLAQTWGEDVVGSRFNASTSCSQLAVAGETALKCSVYAGSDKGGYRDVIFVMHAGKTFRFEAMSPTNNDIVHADLLQILATIRWQS